jgi:hypothetical protein
MDGMPSGAVAVGHDCHQRLRAEDGYSRVGDSAEVIPPSGRNRNPTPKVANAAVVPIAGLTWGRIHG